MRVVAFTGFPGPALRLPATVHFVLRQYPVPASVLTTMSAAWPAPFTS